MKQFRKISVIQSVKKGVSISLVLLLLAAMNHFSVATHYCGGNIAAIKVSISGESATCGMECQGNEQPHTGTIMTTYCCDDVLTSYSTDNIYTPSYSVFPELLQNNMQAFNLLNGLPVLPVRVSKSLNTNVRPPGPLMSSTVVLSDICVFRI